MRRQEHIFQNLVRNCTRIGWRVLPWVLAYMFILSALHNEAAAALVRLVGKS